MGLRGESHTNPVEPVLLYGALHLFIFHQTSQTCACGTERCRLWSQSCHKLRCHVPHSGGLWVEDLSFLGLGSLFAKCGH